MNLRVTTGPRARVTAGLAIGAVCLASCGAGAPGATSAEPAAPSLPTPLATSVDGGGGTWATVPMGNLAQPANTFWQLFFRQDGAHTWSNQVEATATATNGGLVLAPAGPSLLVGVRPSDLLTFTPLISTDDAGRSWSTGLISQGLTSRPTGLAEAPNGDVLALVNRRVGPEVLESTRSLSSWQALITGEALAATPTGPACDPGPLTAVGFVPASTSSGAGGSTPASPVVGTSCRRPGVAGIFEQRKTGWQIGGPRLSPGSGQAQVLGLFPSGDSLAALIGLSAGSAPGGGATSLLAAWSGARSAWASSTALRLTKGAHLLSYGATPDGGLFVLVARPAGKDELAEASATRDGWQQLLPPPPGTTTVAFGPGSTVDALAAGRAVLTVWHLARD
ncbi:MAG TPA: hypothetical protein VMS00_02020, partial [Acidimicrobiales bacterium]|nr:hypothetical protein [Acidimicrobiales bacterium]